MRGLCFAILSVILVPLFVVCPDAAGQPRFVFADRSSVPRIQHTATVLSDGRVLIAGGIWEKL